MSGEDLRTGDAAGDPECRVPLVPSRVSRRLRREEPQPAASNEPARTAEMQETSMTGDAAARLRKLSNTVANFCNDPAVADSDGWQVRIALREDVLPSTTMDMSISPHWLRMRFSIADADARQLVSTHRDELVDMLKTVLTRPRDMSLTID